MTLTFFKGPLRTAHGTSMCHEPLTIRDGRHAKHHQNSACCILCNMGSFRTI